MHACSGILQEQSMLDLCCTAGRKLIFFCVSLSILFRVDVATSTVVVAELEVESGITAHVVHHSPADYPESDHTSLRKVANGGSVYVSLEEHIELHCFAEGGHPAYSKLEWLDGRVPVRVSSDTLESNTLSREVVRNETCIASLIILNLTIYDYGEYRCRCLNDYNSDSFPLENQLYNSRSSAHTAPFCSSGEYLIRLLPKDYHSKSKDIFGEVFITQNHSVVDLVCSNLSDNRTDVEVGVGWTKLDQGGAYVPVDISNSSLTGVSSVRVNITTAKDQAKYICHDTVKRTVYAIQYVSIKDHLQLSQMAIFPPSNNGVRTLTQQITNKAGSSYPLCAFFPSSEIVVSKGNNSYSPQPHYSDDGVMLAHLGNSFFMLEQHPVPKANVMWIVLRLYGRPNVNLLGTIAEELNGVYTCRTKDKSWQPSQKVTVDLHLVTTEIDKQSVQTSELVCPQPLSHFPSPSTTTLPGKPSLTTSPSIPVSLSSFLSVHMPSAAHSTTVTVLPVASTRESKMAIDLRNNYITVLLPTLVVCLVMCTFTVIFCVLLVRKRYRRTKRLGQIQMMNCKPTLANILLRENPNAFFTMACFAAPTLGEGYDSGVCEKETISRQMANCLFKLKQSSLYFAYDKLEFKEELGSGAFGVVKKAVAYNIEPDKSSTIVAVKSLKDIASGEDEKDIISELTVLQYVGSHPNIVSLLGAAAHEGNLFIIVEYCPRGSLLHFLRSSRPDKSRNKATLNPRLLVSMATQVASGMEYLASKNCIHRDLATRNILITENFTLKVADFGLARKIYQSVYVPSGGRVPIKWMAPETILDQVYTTKSDIWSFGVLLWEVMTLGQSPYPGMDPQCIMTVLKNGYRMPNPEGCPHEVYAVMQKCWQLNAMERPNFTELVSVLNTLQEESLLQHLFDSHELSLLEVIDLELKSTITDPPNNFKRDSHIRSHGLISEYHPYIAADDIEAHLRRNIQCQYEAKHYRDERLTWQQTLHQLDSATMSHDQSNTLQLSMESLCSTCKSACGQERQLLRWSSVPTLYTDTSCDSTVAHYENCTTEKESELQPNSMGDSQESVCSDCKREESMIPHELSGISVDKDSLYRPLRLLYISRNDSDTTEHTQTSFAGQNSIMTPKKRPTNLTLAKSTDNSRDLEAKSSSDSGVCSLTSGEKILLNPSDITNTGYLSLVGGSDTEQRDDIVYKPYNTTQAKSCN